MSSIKKQEKVGGNKSTMAQKLYHCASLQTKKTEPSLLASVRSNGAWPPHAEKNAASIPCQISKRRIPHPIVFSANGTPTVTTDPSATPASVVLGRSSFPQGFAFGTASSAYQVEGAWNEGGRGPSIWDTFTHQQPDKIKDKTTGDKATDSYNRYKKDVQLMKHMGVDSYRFSISWSRILPNGTKIGGVNREGVMYYNNLINELIKNGITPYVTLFHWDVPQALEDKYGGFRDRRIVEDFKDYTEVCFQYFGDRVQHWITLNEPWSFSSMGYSLGRHAPGRCSKNIGCRVGNSLTEPYIVTHNLILAHAAAARLYKDHFKALQRGEVGITLVSMWFDPYSESYEDKAAAERSLDFMLGWYMDPLVNGDYPFIMRAIVRDRLPYFTKEESEMIKGSYDFIGINYYTSRYASATPMNQNNTPVLSITEAYAEQKQEKDGVPIGNLQGSWIHVVPIGMKNLLVYMKKRYNNPKIYITENGTAQLDHKNLSLEKACVDKDWIDYMSLHLEQVEKACADKDRIDYMSLHLEQVREAMREGVDVKGYFAWSLTDNFEWNEGYSERFGLNYIDYANDFKRYPKASSEWYTTFLKS